MKRQTCCFTGHRKIPLNQLEQLTQRLKDAVIACIQEGYLYFGAGGALGFDTLAAQTVLNLKQQYPDIKLILVLPCKDQADRWNSQDIKEYERIKACADKIVYTADRYYNGCMRKRNRHLVDCSSLCICYLTEQTGGTKYTVDYAIKSGCVIENLAQKNSRKNGCYTGFFRRVFPLTNKANAQFIIYNCTECCRICQVV